MVKYSQAALRTLAILTEYLSAHYNNRKPNLKGRDLNSAREFYENPRKLTHTLQDATEILYNLQTRAETYVQDETARYNISASIDGYLAMLHHFAKDARQGHNPSNVYLSRFLSGVNNLADQLEQPAKKRTHHVHSTANLAIVLLAMIGLATFLYVQTEPTARVVSPTVANLPLGIAFLAILVIGVMAMSK